MPLSKYNAAFGGKAGSAAKAKAAMTKQYGAKKGEQVFYATKNKREHAAKNKRAAKRRIKRKRRG